MNIKNIFRHIIECGGFANTGATWEELVTDPRFPDFNHLADLKVRAKRARQAWSIFRKTQTYAKARELILKEVKTDKDGNEISKRFVRMPAAPASDEGLDLVGISRNTGTGQEWQILRRGKDSEFGWLTEERRAEFEKQLAEAEQSKIAKTLTFKSEGNDFENWLVLGCVHVPGHNRFLWDGVLRLIDETKPQGLILAGDFADLKSLSSHDKGKERDTTLWDEYLALNEALNEIDSVLGEDTKKVYLFGNHEDRYHRVLKEVENSRFGAALISPQDGMKLGQRGYQILNGWKEDYVLLGDKLEVSHGLYTSRNATKQHLEASAAIGRDCLFFHTHRKGFYSNGLQNAWNCGFLGDVNSEIFKYESRQARQAWSNQFAFVTISEGKHFVSVAECAEKHFFLNGKKY